MFKNTIFTEDQRVTTSDDQDNNDKDKINIERLLKTTKNIYL